MTRSGTSVFRSMLASHPLVEDAGEALNSQTRDGYFDFLERRYRTDPALSRPERSMKLFGEFLEARSASDDPSRIVIIDLKYECFHLVHRPWEVFGMAPAIFEVVKQKADYVIHLTRRNYLRRALSAARANRTKKYHVRNSEPYDGPLPVHLPTRDLVRHFDEAESLYLRTQAHFRETSGFLQIDYELLFDRTLSENVFSDRCVSAIANLFGIEDRFDRRPRLRRTGSESLSASIVNYDEVVRALQGTRFENLLE